MDRAKQLHSSCTYYCLTQQPLLQFSSQSWILVHLCLHDEYLSGFLCHDRYLRKVCPVPAVKSHVPPQYGRRNLRVGAAVILSNLLTRRGERAVQSQRAVRWGGGNGVRHGMLGDVAHGLNAGQRAVMTHTWKHKQQHRRTCHCWLTEHLTLTQPEQLIQRRQDAGSLWY